MSSIRRVVLSSLVMGMLVALGACGPALDTVVVQETDLVAGTVVAVEKEVTATAEPTPAEPMPTEAVPTESPPTEPAPEAGAEREGLRISLASDPDTLDHSADFGRDAERVIQQCIEGLYEYRGDGSLEAAGATGFEVSDDGRAYTIRLREDAVWSDGEPVVAQHYVDYTLGLWEPGEACWDLCIIEGAEAYAAGEVTDPATVGIRAVDDYTLEVRLTEPAAYFETILAGWWYPIRLDLIEMHGDAWTEPGNYVCNGAYLLDEWVRGEKVVMVKNPDYWDVDQVAIERIDMIIGWDALDRYDNDELHVCTRGINWREEAERIFADPVLSQEFLTTPASGVNYIGLNTLRPPTDDVRVRKALALAFDGQRFLDDVMWSPEWTPTSCMIPPNIMGHQPRGTCGHPHDPEQARALLAEAGYPDGEGFPPLHLWGHGTDWTDEALASVTAMWEETLGISMEVRSLDWETYLDYLDGCNESPEALAACEFNAYIMGWIMDYGDPQNILDMSFAPDSTYHHTGWQSERYEELLALARTTYDTAQRVELYREADKILVEEQVAAIPILYILQPALVKEGVTYDYPPFGAPVFKHWELP